MNIYVNGEIRDLPEGCTAEHLVALLGFAGKRIAIEINQELVPRGAHATHTLQPEDRVEIVQAIGGG
jgi:thiamine biosynthesis protein ThiS